MRINSTRKIVFRSGDGKFAEVTQEALFGTLWTASGLDLKTERSSA